jgi:Cysteine-rich CPXCG
MQGNLTPKIRSDVSIGVPSLMPEEFVVECPYCGEQVDVYVEADVKGSFVQDCEVCCNPWRVNVRYEDGERYIAVSRADGSE